MRIIPYLHFDGQCEAAFNFYEQVLGGKILMTMRYSEAPGSEQIPASSGNRIMHTRIMVGDALIMGSDSPEGRYRTPHGMTVALNVADPVEAERLFQGLSVNAVVTMPLGETFWSERFGMLTDQFGIPWMVNCEKPQVGA